MAETARTLVRLALETLTGSRGLASAAVNAHALPPKTRWPSNGKIFAFRHGGVFAGFLAWDINRVKPLIENYRFAPTPDKIVVKLGTQ